MKMGARMNLGLAISHTILIGGLPRMGLIDARYEDYQSRNFQKILMNDLRLEIYGLFFLVSSINFISKFQGVYTAIQ
jgi:hypothetical protein